MIASLVRLAAARAGEHVDRVFVSVAFRSPRAGARGTRAASRLSLDEAASFYDAADRAGELFPDPPAPDLRERMVRELPHGRVADVEWPSRYVPLHPRHAATLDRCPENATVHARWYRHDRPAPALLCVHGWGGGWLPLEERAFPARWLYRIGLDVVLPNLPFHSRRAPVGRSRPMFPSTDPMRSNEGFAQAISDLRALAKALRHRGAPAIAVTGMSLGGFTSALVATVEPAIDAVVPMIPLASVPELLWEHGAGTAARRRAEASGVTLERFAAAFASTTPLRRKPTVPPDAVLLIAGERDRVTPVRHAQLLREHFSSPQGRQVDLVTFPGAHLLQAGRGEAFRALARFLAQRGILPGRQ